MGNKRIWILVAGLCLTAGVAQAAPWRFVVVGDTRSNSSSDNNGVNVTIVSELASQIVAENAAFVLVPGDLAYSGGTTGAFDTWKTAMQPVYNAGIGVYPIRGNHDTTGTTAGTNWDAAFASSLPNNGPTGEVDRTYSFTYNNALVIGLDEYVTSHRVNQTWLDTQLANKTATHVFTFGHEPAFKINHSDCLDDYPTNRNTFWASLANAGAKVYFAGHDHFYDDARIDDDDGNPNDDLYQLVVGTGGAPFSSDSAYNGSNNPYTPTRVCHEADYGYTLVEVDGPTVTMTWKHQVSAGVYAATSEVLTYTVPEPAGLGLLAAAMFGLLRLGRRR